MTRRLALLWALLLGACGAPPTPLAPSPSVTVTSAPLAPRIARVEAAVAERFAALDMSGVSVAVVGAGRIVWAGGRGLAVIETDVEATAQTVYGVGLVSKPIAAMAVARLAGRPGRV